MSRLDGGGEEERRGSTAKARPDMLAGLTKMEPNVAWTEFGLHTPSFPLFLPVRQLHPSPPIVVTPENERNG